MLEITEIIKRSNQGATKPFLCKASDGKTYYIKGHFDLWVHNEDRTLTKLGGNPNLLWQSEQSKLYIIDHNLIFENDFDYNGFWKTYVFRQIIFDHVFDRIERLNYQSQMQKALECWQLAWDTIPSTWKIINEETGLFEPDETLQRLITDAEGNIWRKLP